MRSNNARLYGRARSDGRGHVSSPHAVASILLVALMVACGSDPKPFETDAFADEIDEILDDELSDEISEAEIRCPIDDWQDIVEDSFEQLSDEDLVRDALRTNDTSAAFEFDGGDYLDCSFFDADESLGAGLFFLEAPRDADDYAEEFAGDDARVDIDETNEYRGGRFRHVCVEFSDDDITPYCQVEWLNDDVLIGLYIFGEDADRIDTELLETGFRPQLDAVMAQFTT